jgi:parallel beta-helix repeat protein
MQSMLRRKVRFGAVAQGALAAALTFACQDDIHQNPPKEAGAPETGGKGASDAGDSGSGGSSGSGGAKGDSGPTTGPDGAKCSTTLKPSADDQSTVQGALDSVKTGDTLCLTPGTYKFTNHLTLAKAASITFVGTGAKRDDVLLDFTGQTSGDEGVLVTTDGFTIENLSIKNTQGNGIKVQADNSVFRNIKVGWDRSGLVDGGPVSGGYAIYPTGCKNTLMENNEAYGAADAGIYTGQCNHVIARNNDSHDNVLGIEIENTIDAEVYGNEVHGNTTGFLLDLLPDLQQRTNRNYLVHDNHVYGNNLPNFAQKNTLAASAPQGTGILVLASRVAEITKNNVEDNGGVAIIVLSYDIIDVLAVINGGMASTPDPATSRWPEKIYIHDNTFSGNGNDPQGTYGLFAVASDAGKKTIPYTVLWDGILNPHGYYNGDDAGGATDADAKICLGTTEQKGFLNFKGGDPKTLVDPKAWSTDTKPHQCTLPPVSPLTP